MRIIMLLLSIPLLLSSCGEASRKDILPRNTGSWGEICVVAPHEIWNLSVGDALKERLNVVMYGLPQAELKMKRIEVDERGFNDHFLTHRNILHIEVRPKKENKVYVRRNVQARQQLYITIYIQSPDDLLAVLDDRAEEIIDLFHQAEIQRLIERNKAFGNDGLNEKIAELSGLNISMQKDFEIAIERPNFLWLRLDMSKPLGGYQHSIKQGLMIYSRPYSDTAQFSDSSLFAWKDSINRKYVKGPQESLMNISYRAFPPKSKTIVFQEQSAKEIRGLWRMDGYFMGGPFYSLAFFNPENGLQYMVEGYVYAPQFDKIDYIREIEAMAKSVSPVQD